MRFTQPTRVGWKPSRINTIVSAAPINHVLDRIVVRTGVTNTFSLRCDYRVGTNGGRGEGVGIDIAGGAPPENFFCFQRDHDCHNIGGTSRFDPENKTKANPPLCPSITLYIFYPLAAARDDLLSS